MIFDDTYLFLQFGNFFVELDVLIVVFGDETRQPGRDVFHGAICEHNTTIVENNYDVRAWSDVRRQSVLFFRFG